MAGFTRGRLPDWRLFKVHKISWLRITEQQFDKAWPGYKRTSNLLSAVFCFKANPKL